MTTSRFKKKIDENSLTAMEAAHAQALAEKDEMIQNLLDLSPFPITVNRIADSCFLLVNPSWCKLTGYAPEEVIGRTAQELGLDVSDEERAQIIQTLKQHGQLENVKTRIKTKDGRFIHAQMSAKVICFQGEYCLLSNTIYIEKLSETQEALRESERRFKNMLNSFTETYYEVDLNGTITYFNDTLLSAFGRTKEELLGMNFRQYTLPEDSQRVYNAYFEVFQGIRAVNCVEYGIRSKDGTVAYVESSASLLSDDSGRPIGFYGIIRNRTEQKKTEMDLQKSEKQYRLLVENANAGIYITQEGRIRFHNPRTSIIMGYDGQELARMLFFDLVHPEDRQAVSAALHHHLAEGQVLDVCVFRIVNKQQQIVWVELSAVGIIWEGQPAALNFLRDVTHLKKTEERLRQAQKMEAIGTLAGGIAHDFNNILYAIFGFTELALDDAPPGTALEENLKDILGAGKRARELVRQILTFARQSEEKVEPIMVSPIVKEALKLIRSSIPSTIEIRARIDSPSSIQGNPTQVHQIIMNL